VQAAPESRVDQSFRGRLNVGTDPLVRTVTAGVLAQFRLICLTPLVYAGLPYSVMFALRVRQGRWVAGVLGLVVSGASLVVVAVGVAAGVRLRRSAGPSARTQPGGVAVQVRQAAGHGGGRQRDAGAGHVGAGCSGGVGVVGQVVLGRREQADAGESADGLLRANVFVRGCR
jgi:hypothetical protein